MIPERPENEWLHFKDEKEQKTGLFSDLDPFLIILLFLLLLALFWKALYQ